MWQKGDEAHIPAGPTVKHYGTFVRQNSLHRVFNKQVEWKYIPTKTLQAYRLQIEYFSCQWVINFSEWLIAHNDPFQYFENVWIAFRTVSKLVKSSSCWTKMIERDLFVTTLNATAQMNLEPCKVLAILFKRLRISVLRNTFFIVAVENRIVCSIPLEKELTSIKCDDVTGHFCVIRCWLLNGKIEKWLWERWFRRRWSISLSELSIW